MSSQPPQFGDDGHLAEHEQPLWEPRRAPLWIVPFSVLIGLLACFTAAVAVAYVSDYEWTSAAVFLGWSALLGHVVGLSAYVFWRPSRRGPRLPRISRTGDGQSGISFTYSKWGYYWYAGLCVLAACCLVPFIVMGFDSGVVSWLISLVAILGCAALLYSVGLMLYLAPGRLTLTPEGVHHRSLTLVQYSPWPEVLFARPFSSGHERAVLIHVEEAEASRLKTYLPKWFGTAEQPLLPSIVVRDTWLVTHPALVLQTVRHYHANPQDRAELGTQAAVDRIRQRRFFLR